MVKLCGEFLQLIDWLDELVEKIENAVRDDPGLTLGELSAAFPNSFFSSPFFFAARNNHGNFWISQTICKMERKRLSDNKMNSVQSSNESVECHKIEGDETWFA